MALEFNDGNFEEILESDKLTVVDFWAEWCGPCKMVGPIIDGLADEYGAQVNIGKLDIDNNPETAFQYKVRSIPTVVFIKNGKAIDKIVGAATRTVYENKIKQHMTIEVEIEIEDNNTSEL